MFIQPMKLISDHAIWLYKAWMRPILWTESRDLSLTIIFQIKALKISRLTELR